MGLSPALILGGILAMALIAIVGAIESPSKTTEILGFCGVITGTLLFMLKNDQDVKRLNHRIDSSDQLTTERAARVVETVQQKGTEVKQLLRAGDEIKNDKLDDLKSEIADIKHQTNGGMEQRFQKIERSVETATSKVIEALPKVIEETVPKVVAPILAPGNEK